MGGGQHVRRQQVPNQFYVRAEVTRASYRARAGGSRNQGAGPQGPQGTYRLQRRYFLDHLDLVQTLQAAKRKGADVESELRGFGTVYVGPRHALQGITADEAIRLAFPRCDISPPHLKDVDDPGRKPEESIARAEPDADCPGGCGARIRPTQAKCSECAGRAALEWGARQVRRR